MAKLTRNEFDTLEYILTRAQKSLMRTVIPGTADKFAFTAKEAYETNYEMWSFFYELQFTNGVDFG